MHRQKWNMYIYIVDKMYITLGRACLPLLQLQLCVLQLSLELRHVCLQLLDGGLSLSVASHHLCLLLLHTTLDLHQCLQCQVEKIY